MGPSLPALPVLVALLLGFTLTTQAFDQLDYCRPPKICPLFTRVSTNQRYEERLYEPSVWMCTEEEEQPGAGSLSATKAGVRLNNFRNLMSWALGVVINPNTWPSLVTVDQRRRVQDFHLCWMVPPGVTVYSYGKVTVKSFPKTTVFVRLFGGFPSMESGRWNALKLMEDLLSDGKSFDPTVAYGASYDRYITHIHHNEIWLAKV